ncbi:hypothetical protein SNEBB_010035 [Seison nebaliae]|nr:hypothetical protein SNEBB_010035 [Seison nebaliae]
MNRSRNYQINNSTQSPTIPPLDVSGKTIVLATISSFLIFCFVSLLPIYLKVSETAPHNITSSSIDTKQENATETPENFNITEPNSSKISHDSQFNISTTTIAVTENNIINSTSTNTEYSVTSTTTIQTISNVFSTTKTTTSTTNSQLPRTTTLLKIKKTSSTTQLSTTLLTTISGERMSYSLSTFGTTANLLSTIEQSKSTKTSEVTERLSTNFKKISYPPEIMRNKTTINLPTTSSLNLTVSTITSSKKTEENLKTLDILSSTTLTQNSTEIKITSTSPISTARNTIIEDISTTIRLRTTLDSTTTRHEKRMINFKNMINENVLLSQKVVFDLNQAHLNATHVNKMYEKGTFHTYFLANHSNEIRGYGVSPQDTQFIVQAHNHIRRNVKPNPTYMMKMYWDPKLAFLAQRWSNQCRISHDCVKCRSLLTYPLNVGQNVAVQTQNWSHTLKGWWNESTVWRYGKENMDFLKVGHYSQLVLDKVYKVGCGFTLCQKATRLLKLFVCNYYPSQSYENVKFPYELSTKSNGTCGGCVNTCSNSLCDCQGQHCTKISQKLDPSNCACKST